MAFRLVRFRRKITSLHHRFLIFPDFPSEPVFMAYLNPVVDNSTEKFSWAVPNFVAVRDFAGK